MKNKWYDIKMFVIDNKEFRAKDIPHGDTGQMYINYLHKAGFIKRIKRGYYKMLLSPKNYTLKEIKKYAYGDSNINKLLRKEKLNKINGKRVL